MAAEKDGIQDMAKVSNQEILTKLASEAPAEVASVLEQVALADGQQAYAILQDYPTAKNAFINALTNKVVKTAFYSKVFSNPLAMLHRGKLEFGASIEQMFVDMATKKGFRENFGTSAAESLIGKQESSVNVSYITKNFEYKYKVSISDIQLRTAFMSGTGLGELISQLINSAVSAAYFDEFLDMKALVKAAAGYKELTMVAGTGKMTETALTAAKAPRYMSVEKLGATPTPHAITEKLRALSQRLTFPSTARNMAGVNQWSRPEDLIFLTTPELQASLDVNVLAQAFNVSSADVRTRIVVVDELPAVAESSATTHAADKVIGLLVDKDFIQTYDTVMETRQFENGDTLTTNLFLHKQGMMANCYFAQAIALVKA